MGEKGWRCGESTRLHQCGPGSFPELSVIYGSSFNLLLVIVVAPRGFFSRYSGFPLSSKTNISKLQFDPESEGHRFVGRKGLLSVALIKQSWSIDWLIWFMVHFHANLQGSYRKCLLTHHSWWWKCSDKGILVPSISLAEFLSFLKCIHLHTPRASIQSLRSWPCYFLQQEHYELQGHGEPNSFQRDGSIEIVQKEKKKNRWKTKAQVTAEYVCYHIYN